MTSQVGLGWLGFKKFCPPKMVDLALSIQHLDPDPLGDIAQNNLCNNLFPHQFECTRVNFGSTDTIKKTNAGYLTCP